MTENQPVAEEPTPGGTAPPATAGEPTVPVPTEATSARPAGPGGEVVPREEAERRRAAEPGRRTHKAPERRPEASKHTRIGAAWVAVAIAVVVLVALLIFILENNHPTTIQYFGATGQLPLGVLVLFSAAGGALLVIVLGFARIIQLRWLARRDRRATTETSASRTRSVS